MVGSRTTVRLVVLGDSIERRLWALTGALKFAGNPFAAAQLPKDRQFKSLLRRSVLWVMGPIELQTQGGDQPHDSPVARLRTLQEAVLCRLCYLVIRATSPSNSH